jgi:acyl-CoA reductase-like NAD-dependent aldehyde dehydrogenase
MKNLIGKNWVDSNSDNVIEVRNPATNELIDVVYGASEKDVTLAVSEAKKAYNYWANISVFERGEIMRKFSVLLKENIS